MIAFQRGDSDPIQVQATAEARLETFHLKQMQACARTDAQSSRKNARKECVSESSQVHAHAIYAAQVAEHAGAITHMRSTQMS